jgi:ABC-type dipeptide/oligopeptide/nickel transport system permease subunit
MIAGRRYWILIWYGFLLIGVAGAVASAYWGRRHPGRNLDEILRSLATILLSIGMLLLLYGVETMAGRILLGVAVALFFGAFWVGRTPGRRPPPGPRGPRGP